MRLVSLSLALPHRLKKADNNPYTQDFDSRFDDPSSPNYVGYAKNPDGTWRTYEQAKAQGQVGAKAPVGDPSAVQLPQERPPNGVFAPVGDPSAAQFFRLSPHVNPVVPPTPHPASIGEKAVTNPYDNFFDPQAPIPKYEDAPKGSAPSGSSPTVNMQTPHPASIGEKAVTNPYKAILDNFFPDDPQAPIPKYEDAPKGSAPSGSSPTVNMQTAQSGLGSHVNPAVPPTPHSASIGAQVTAPFQPGAQQPTVTAPTPQAQQPTVTAPTPQAQQPTVNMQTAQSGLGSHVNPAVPPTPHPASIGAQVNAPFQPGAQQPTAPTFQMPSAQEWNQAHAQAQHPTVTAPTPQAQPGAQQSRPVMTGAGASTFASTPVAAATWQAGNMAGKSYANHAPLPGLTQSHGAYHSDFGRPTSMEKLTPDQQFNSTLNNHFGWGNSLEDATRNRMTHNTNQMHQIGAGRGGTQHGADGGTQFFGRDGTVTAEKRIDGNGNANLTSMYGTGKATFSPDARRGIDWSKGSVRENGQPWKPKVANESQQAFLERMLGNAPEILQPVI